VAGARCDRSPGHRRARNGRRRSPGRLGPRSTPGPGTGRFTLRRGVSARFTNEQLLEATHHRADTQNGSHCSTSGGDRPFPRDRQCRSIRWVEVAGRASLTPPAQGPRLSDGGAQASDQRVGPGRWKPRRHNVDVSGRQPPNGSGRTSGRGRWEHRGPQSSRIPPVRRAAVPTRGHQRPEPGTTRSPDRCRTREA
jgi:hypothetical protein